MPQPSLFERLTWGFLLLLAALCFVFMMEHFKVFSTPPTRAAYLWALDHLQ